VLDAGALALSKDPGATQVEPSPGFGWLATLDGRRLPGARVTSISQQHGVADPGSGHPPAWGARLRVLPNHSCLAAACFDRFVVVRGRDVVAEWLPAHGW
jgi:D-serine deaminase-like pyridoxal phosphate-dependent protein